MTFERLVQQIHEKPHRGVIAITGGGTEALGELLRRGNGSKTLLEAVVPYDTAAFDRFLGGAPDKYCTQTAACQLAMAAYLRAKSFPGDYPRFGVGATCSLAKEKERQGRVHQR